MAQRLMRGTPGMRLVFAILSPLFLVLCVVAIRGEETRPWMQYQAEFRALFVQRATAKLRAAETQQDAKEIAHWRRVVDEASSAAPEVAQVYLEDLKVADRCVTCHRGIDNALFADAPQPFRTHSGELLKHHPATTFGCTPCHQGQGLATTVDGAHGREAGWATPLLPAAYVQVSCARCHEVTHGLAGAATVTRGADLFMEKGCYGCHDAQGITYRPKFAPPLAPLSTKLLDLRRFVYAWIKEPTHVSADTMMPNFSLDDDAARKITAFVATLPAEHQCEPVDLAGASVEEGEHLFVERGCAGCHAVKADDHSVAPRVPNLAGIASKVKPEWIDHWISDPKAYNPDAAMPKTELTDKERHAVVAYLLTLKRTELLPDPPAIAASDAEEGKQLVKRYECFGCHAIPGFETTRPAVPNLEEFARKPVADLDFATTTDVPRTKWDWLDRKLREPRAYATESIKLLMPAQRMTDEERQALVTYVVALDRPALPARFARPASESGRARRELGWMVAHFNCNGCHRVDDRDARLARLVERRNLLPPTLDGVGARLQGQYFYQFLLEPKQIRPWLKIRMPLFRFAEKQAQALVEGFAAAGGARNPHTYVAKATIDAEHFQRGIRRFQHYKCVQCHPTSLDQGLPPGVDPEDLSINLTLAKTRLRPEWIADFLARPKQIAGAQTRMPTVFYSVDGEPKVERPTDDIADITTYLMGMTEPPEVTLQAEVEEREKVKEKEKAVDWSTLQY
jgi:mono/diheme cytochrome c family protein